MIQIQIEQWQQLKAKLSQLQQQLNILKKQNEQLKKKKEKKKKKVNFQQNLQVFDEINCHSQLNNDNPEYFQRTFISENNFFEFNHNKSSQQVLLDNKQNLNLKLIQKICIYGPDLSNLNDITFKKDERQYLSSNLFYPSIEYDYQKYGNYIHPQMIRIKPILAQKQNIQAQKILYQKIKSQNFKVFIFQGIQQDILNNSSSFMLPKVNPSNFLFSITLQFKDFIIQSQPPVLSTSKSSLKSIDLKKSLLNLNTQFLHQQQLKLQTASLHDIEFRNQSLRMYLTTFSINIFTYFPFMDFMQNILINLIEEIKIKRVKKYLECSNRLKQVDVFYFIQQIKQRLKNIQQYLMMDINKIHSEISFKINNKSLNLCLNGEMIMEQVYKGWIHKILKLFNKNNLYQIYSMIILQQPVYFICQDSHILTYVILLFSSIFPCRFSYPYPVISIIFNNQLLHTPFTSIIGINQSHKFIQKQQIQQKLDLDSKTVVLISEKQIKIKGNYLFNPPKQSQLRYIFKKYYQKINKSMTFSFKDLLSKKQQIKSSQQAQQDNTNVFMLFQNLQDYFNNKIFKFIPKNTQIDLRVQELELKTKNPSAINVILDQIIKKYKENSVNFGEDQFIVAFISTQIFSIFLSEYYKLR